MITIIPMAGLGTRFSQEGYLLPKPLIPVSGKPMIARVVERLPESENIVFIIRQEYKDIYAIDTLIQTLYPRAHIRIDPDPKGQASTCMIAIQELSDDEEVFIAPCDSSQLYNKERFNTLRSRDDVDAIFWSFTHDELLTKKPNAWGWFKLENDNETILDMSVKIPVSDTPFNDHAVTANFYFKRAADFKSAYAKMHESKHTIGREYYIDAMPIFLRALGKKSIIFDVDLYVSWGKPEDLHLFDFYEYAHRMNIDIKQNALWHRFFSQY